MCGIAGVFHRNGDKLDPGVLVRMTRTLAHRGPDGEGYFRNGLTLGTRGIGVCRPMARPVVHISTVVHTQRIARSDAARRAGLQGSP